MAWKKNKKAAEEEVTSSADPNPENNEAIFGNLWDSGQNNDAPAEDESASEESNEEEFQLPDDGSIQIAYDADGNGYYISYDQETDQYFDPYSGDVYDINSMYDAEGNPFKFFATEEIPEEASTETPASEPLYEDSSTESSIPAAQDLSTDDSAVNDNVTTVSESEQSDSSNETPQISEPNFDSSESAEPQIETLQPQSESNNLENIPETVSKLPNKEESIAQSVETSQPQTEASNLENIPETIVESANEEPLVTESNQTSQAQVLQDDNLSEETTLSNQEPSEFSLNSAPEAPTPVSAEAEIKPLTAQATNEPIINSLDNFNVAPVADNVKAISQNESPIENNVLPESLPVNLNQNFESQINQPMADSNQSQISQIQTPIDNLSNELTVPEVAIQSIPTQEITEPVYDSYEETASAKSNFVSPNFQAQNNLSAYTPVSSATVNNYQQPAANNIFIPSPQPISFGEQVLTPLHFVNQPSSNFAVENNFAPTPETFKPNSSFSVVESSTDANIFANKANSFNLNPQNDLNVNVNVREEPTTEIFLDSINDEISQITNEPKADYTHPLPISAVLNPPLSFEQDVKEENAENKIHYIAYETPKVKNSFWSKYVGNEKYGHLDDSGKWVWDGYFYDNEEFVSNKSADDEIQTLLTANESNQGYNQQSADEDNEFKFDPISSSDEDDEEIIPVSGGSESSDSVKTYANSEYGSDIKILSDEQATKLISEDSSDSLDDDFESINVTENENVELINQDSKQNKEDEITVEEILPQKTLFPEQKIVSQEYEVIEEMKEKEPVVVEQSVAVNLEESLPKANNLSTFEEPTNELEQLTSEIVSGDQTDISEDSLFKTEKYDEEVKKSFASTLDFLVKSKQEANTVYKKISKELRIEIENLSKNIEKLKIEFKDNEGRIRSQKSEIMRTLSSDFNPGNNYTSGRDFDNLQHAQDYNKHLLQTIKDNETRLVVLVSNQKQLKVVFENRIIKINSDINKMQKIINNVNSTNYNINLLTANQSLINDNNNYQNQVNSFLPTPMNNYLTNPANSLVPFENTVGIYNPGNDLLFDNNNISNILNDYQQRPLLSPTGLIQNEGPFNLSDSIFNKKSLDFDNNFSDPLAPLSYPSLGEYKSNYFDDDFETLVPDRTSSLDDLLGGNSSFITGTDELFNDDYDTKVSFTDDLENILSK